MKLLPPVMTPPPGTAEAEAPLLTEDRDSPFAPDRPLGPFASDVALHTDEEPLVGGQHSTFQHYVNCSVTCKPLLPHGAKSTQKDSLLVLTGIS